MSERPAILIIHGAWHVPAHYDNLTTKLRAAGFHVSIPRLLTCTDAIPNKATFEQDCALIRSTATQLADEGRSILVLMHSYGGVIGTHCLEGFSARARAAAGLRGGVIRLVYMCAFLLPLHANLSSPFGGELPSFMDEQPENGTCTMQRPEYRFYDEVTDEAERQRYLDLLTGHPTSAQKDGTIKYAAYRDIPTTYVLCENDRGLVKEIQVGMIEAAEAPLTKVPMGKDIVQIGGVYGGKVHVVSCSGGHSAYIAVPEEIVDGVEQALSQSEKTPDATNGVH